MKCEFSKKLLVVDYAIMIILFICTVIFQDIDLTTVDVTWIAQLGISSAAYYWKAKCENRIKIPAKVIESLPEDVREQLNLTEVIASIIQSE